MIKAVDLATGKTLWDRPLGTAERNGPWGVPSLLPFEIGLPNNGGVLTTGSGVAFVGATTDDDFRAIDVKTGKTLWQDKLPAGGQATPMTYEIGGRQFVIIVAGGHHGMMTPEGDYVIAYALPERMKWKPARQAAEAMLPAWCQMVGPWPIDIPPIPRTAPSAGAPARTPGSR